MPAKDGFSANSNNSIRAPLAHLERCGNDGCMATGFHVAVTLHENHARPRVARRKHYVQRFLLDEVARGASVSQAIECLQGISKTEPARYRNIVGSDRVFARDTFKGYWKQVPLAIRNDARAGNV
jgi:hypothetical protein